ncbi:MAG: hypothetical protein JWM85_2613 [Acidimicrobiaceae bacterium]|nr:hypothetical protein [Acidimicrobiaceae bacterium]
MREDAAATVVTTNDAASRTAELRRKNLEKEHGRAHSYAGQVSRSRGSILAPQHLSALSGVTPFRALFARRSRPHRSSSTLRNVRWKASAPRCERARRRAHARRSGRGELCSIWMLAFGQVAAPHAWPEGAPAMSTWLTLCCRTNDPVVPPSLRHLHHLSGGSRSSSAQASP